MNFKNYKLSKNKQKGQLFRSFPFELNVFLKKLNC